MPIPASSATITSAPVAPFGALAHLRGEVDPVTRVVEALRPDATLTVLGPLEAGTAQEALVRAANAESLADALGAALPSARLLGRLRVEVDPPRI